MVDAGATAAARRNTAIAAIACIAARGSVVDGAARAARRNTAVAAAAVATAVAAAATARATAATAGALHRRQRELVGQAVDKLLGRARRHRAGPQWRGPRS